LLLWAKHILLTTIVCAASIASHAQNNIQVVGDDGTPITNALITIQSLGENYALALYPNDSGKVSFDLKLPIVVQVVANHYKNWKDTLYEASIRIILTPAFTSLPRLVVTGSAKPISAEDNVHKVKVVDQRKIKELAAINLADALSNEININISQDAQLGSGISLRGIQGQQVKILIDGIPMIGRNDGMLDLSQINMNNVDRIEIIEGPMSIIYGSDASGGLINIINKQPQKNQSELSLQQMATSNGIFNTFGSISLANKKNQFNLNGSRYLFQGFDENPDLRNPLWKPKRQLMGNAFYQHYFGDQIKQSIRLNAFNEYLIAKGSPIVTPWEVIALDEYYTTDRLNLSTQTHFRNRNNRLNISLNNAFNYYERNRIRKVTNLEDLSQTDAQVDSKDTQIFNSFNSRLIGKYVHNSNFSFGFGYDINLENGRSDRLSSTDGIYDYAAFYNVMYTKNKLSIEQGSRVSYNSQFAIPIIPAVHVKYNLLKNAQLIASYAKGYRAPSMKERYLYFVDQNHDVIGNPNLESELSHSFNFSIQNHVENENHDLNYEINVFYTQIDDMIVLAALNSNSTSFRYENIDEFYSQGGNIRFSYGRKNFELNTGFGLVGTKQVNDSFLADPTFLYRPDAQINLGYFVEFINTKFNLLNKFNGSVPNYFRENNTLKLQYSTPFVMTDFTAMRTFAADKITLGLTVKNIFNITSIQNTTNIGSAHSAGANSSAVALGRHFAINFIYTIKSEKK